LGSAGRPRAGRGGGRAGGRRHRPAESGCVSSGWICPCAWSVRRVAVWRVRGRVLRRRNA
jgi:hypothetical protein